MDANKQVSGLAISAFVLGILSLVIGWIPIIGWMIVLSTIIVGVLAIVFIKKNSTTKGIGLAIAGLGMGAGMGVFLLLIGIGFILFAIFFGTIPNPDIYAPSDQSIVTDKIHSPTDSYWSRADISIISISFDKKAVVTLQNNMYDTIIIQEFFLNEFESLDTDIILPPGDSYGFRFEALDHYRFYDVLIRYKYSDIDYTYDFTGITALIIN